MNATSIHLDAPRAGRALLLALITMTAPACVGSLTGSDDDSHEGDPDGGVEELACEELGRTYTGIGGNELQAGRVSAEPYSDHLRMKPASALASEYARVLGGVAVDVAPYAPTFGAPAARWYEEPQATADTVYASFTLAYQGCHEFTASPDAYQAAPTEETAATVCADFARRFWDREPAAPEIEACVEYAVSGTTSLEDARDRWAYTCASVLSAAGFVGS